MVYGVNTFFSLNLHFFCTKVLDLICGRRYVLGVTQKNEGSMNKRSIVNLTEEQNAALELAAHKVGMTVSTFLRHQGILAAAQLGFQVQQPKAD